MANRAKKTCLFVNAQKVHAPDLAIRIRGFLEERGLDCSIHDSLSIPAHPSLKGVDLAITLGGDGTVLAAARYVAALDIPIFPINLGNFGFITEVGRDDWEADLGDYLAGSLKTTRRLMLSTRVLRGGRVVFESLALNDCVIAGSGISKLLTLRVHTSGTYLGTYKADGVIIASPTGSTAYSAAAGGPILHPELRAMVLTPICPFTLSNRPVVVPGEEALTIELPELQKSELMLSVDGQLSFSLLPKDILEIKAYEKPVVIIASGKRSFYDVLRSKLNWSGGPDA